MSIKKVTIVALLSVVLVGCAVVIIDSNKHNNCRKGITTEIVSKDSVCNKETDEVSKETEHDTTTN